MKSCPSHRFENIPFYSSDFKKCNRAIAKVIDSMLLNMPLRAKVGKEQITVSTPFLLPLTVNNMAKSVSQSLEEINTLTYL